MQYSCSADTGVTITVLGNSFVCSRKGEVVLLLVKDMCRVYNAIYSFIITVGCGYFSIWSEVSGNTDLPFMCRDMFCKQTFISAL